MPNTDADPKVCIFGECVTASRTSGTYYKFVEDFGKLIDYTREYVLPYERFSSETGSARDREIRKEVEKQLGALQKQYEAEGYCAALGKELERISDEYFFERELGPVFMMPDDVSALLDTFGNPLVDDDDDESAEDKPAPVFNITNPRHWDAMVSRIEWQNENW